MNSTILNDATVMVVNNNEIFNYQPKRKINVINENDKFSLLDKNFTYVITVHPISPYTQNANDITTETKPFLEAKDLKCPTDFINTDDIQYLNLDAFDWQNDTTGAFYPILSLDGTCLYDSSSLDACEFFNCFTLFIYRGVLHWVINDETTQPSLVHCKIQLDNVKEIQNKYYHVILSRNDNIFTMNLLFDKNSLLSSHDITINNYIEDEHYYVDRSRPNSDFSYDDLTNEEQATVSIDDDTTFTMSLNIPGSQSIYSIDLDTSNYSGTIGVEIALDNGRFFANADQNFETNDTYSFIPNPTENDFSPYSQQSTEISFFYWENESLYAVDATKSEIAGIWKLQVEPGKKYGVSIGGINNFDYLDYLKNAFMEYNDMYGALQDDTENKFLSATTGYLAIKIHKDFDENKPMFIQDDYNKFRFDYKILHNNINIGDFISPDATICVGYLERWPKNIEIDKKLFKNSFLGYITEFAFFKDQAYLSRLEKLTEYSLSKYLINSDNTTEFNIAPNYNLYYEGYNIFDYDPNVYAATILRQKTLINPNNIPVICKPITDSSFTYTQSVWYNKTGISAEFDNGDSTGGDSTGGDSTGGEANMPVIGDEGESGEVSSNNTAGITLPVIQQIANFKIDNITLIDELANLNIEADYNNYIKNQTELLNITFIGTQDATDSTQTIYTPTNVFCIFNFDIMKDLDQENIGYSVQNQTRFLIRSDFSMEEYDENKSWAEYCELDTTHGYIDIDWQKDISSNKNELYNVLNNYIDSISDDTNNLYMTRFYITCFRDSRYMFLYNTYSDLPRSLTYNNHSSFAITKISHQINNPVYDENHSKLVIPYNTNFYNQYGYKYSFYIGMQNDQIIGNNPNLDIPYLIHGFYYSKNDNDSQFSTMFTYTLDFYESDLNVYKYEKIINGISPDSEGESSQSDLIIDTTYYDTLQIIDQERNVYAERPTSIFGGNRIYRNFEYDTYEADNDRTELIQDLNKFYYANITNTVVPSKTTIIKSVNLLNGSSVVPTQVINLGINDDNNMVFQYNPTAVTDKSQLVITYDLTGNQTERYKQALSQVVSSEYSLYNTRDYIFPDYKVENKSVFVEDQELKNTTNYAIKNLYKDIYTLTKNNSMNNMIYNKTRFDKMDQFILTEDTFATKRNKTIHSFISYTHIDYKFYNNMYIPINVVYDGNKRSIHNI